MVLNRENKALPSAKSLYGHKIIHIFFILFNRENVSSNQNVELMTITVILKWWITEVNVPSVTLKIVQITGLRADVRIVIDITLSQSWDSTFSS